MKKRKTKIDTEVILMSIITILVIIILLYSIVKINNNFNSNINNINNDTDNNTWRVSFEPLNKSLDRNDTELNNLYCSTRPSWECKMIIHNGTN